MKKKFCFFLFVFLCFCSSFSYALNLGQLRTELRRNLRDTDATRRRYSDSTLLDYINESQREIVNATWLADKTTVYVLVPNTTYYDLPSDLLAVHQVYFKNKQGQTIELDEDSQKGLYDKNPDWEKDSIGTPNEFWVSNPTSPVVTSTANLRISFISIPNNLSTGTVTIWYYSKCADLSSDSDIPFDGRSLLFSYHMAIVYQATAKIKFSERKTDEANLYLQLFVNYVNEIKSNLGKMPDYSSGMRVGK